MGGVLSVVVAIGIPFVSAIGLTLTLDTQKDVKGWYKTLKKPSWTPPNWAFGPVWSGLYTMMGISSWKVWKNGGGLVPLGLYSVQLLLNLAWTPIFFKAHALKAAVVDITALLGVLGATIVSFHGVSPTAAYLMFPYLGWASLATALTVDIYKNNKTIPPATKPAALTPAKFPVKANEPAPKPAPAVTAPVAAPKTPEVAPSKASEVAPPKTPEVAPPKTPEVAPPKTPEVAPPKVDTPVASTAAVASKVADKAKEVVAFD